VADVTDFVIAMARNFLLENGAVMRQANGSIYGC
jgi:hypothetical protein